MSIHTIRTVVDVPVCTSIEDIRAAASEDAEKQMLQAHIIKGWPQNKDVRVPSLGRYWPIRHGLAMIDGVTIKDK